MRAIRSMRIIGFPIMRCMVSVKPKGAMPVGWVVMASMVAGWAVTVKVM